MTQGEIYTIISDFIDLIENGKGNTESNHGSLMLILDQLALAYHFVTDQFDDQYHPEPPKTDSSQLRKIIGERFPNYGYYNLPCEVTSKIGETQIMVGDAVDDITDIALELYEVKWRWNNTSIDDALWCFKFTYIAHWGNHLRRLQFYLYAQNYES